MQSWLPSVISGIFSIAVVVIGAVAIERRERHQRATEHTYAVNVAQRKAVATYIQELRSATALWEEERAEADRHDNESEMFFAMWKALDKCFLSYRNSGTFLDLEITNPQVRIALVEIDEEIENRHRHYSQILTYNNVESWSEIHLARPMFPSLNALINALATTARENLH